MKEIDNIVKKVLLESLNEKADEITQKIQEKISGEMEEGEMEEGKFKDELKKAYKRKHPEEKFPASLRKKYFSDDDDEDETDVMSGEFDYVAETECMEGDCGETEESMVPGEGEEHMKNYRKRVMRQLLNLYPDDKHLKKELGIEDEDEDGEMKEELHGNQSKIDVAKPKGKITKADFDKLRSMKEEDTEMEEGNAFLGARADAKSKGKKEFDFNGETYPVKESFKYSIQFGDSEVVLSENELITMIEEIVLEEKKGNIKSTGKSKGMVEYDRVHKKDEDINKKATEESFKKMRDYVKAGSKGNFEPNPKHFPKTNGQISKMDKKAYVPSDAVEEYISDFAYPGQTNLTFDEIKPDDEKIKKYLEGDSTTGNSSEYANAETTEVGKKLYKNYKENPYGEEQKNASYKRVTVPVDVAGENKGAKSYKKSKGQKALDKLSESNEQKEVLNEEMYRMIELLSYNKKTQ